MVERKPFVHYTKGQMQRARELAARLPEQTRVDKRGMTTLLEGIVSDLDAGHTEGTQALVAETPGNPWLTVITGTPLAACEHALLVIRPGTDGMVKLTGRLGASRTGCRPGDDELPAPRFFAQFTQTDGARSR